MFCGHLSATRNVEGRTCRESAGDLELQGRCADAWRNPLVRVDRRGPCRARIRRHGRGGFGEQAPVLRTLRAMVQETVQALPCAVTYTGGTQDSIGIRRCQQARKANRREQETAAL